MTSFAPRGPIVAVDLDQTLIFSIRAGGVTDVPLVIAEVSEGSAASLMTAHSRDLLNELSDLSEVVVVTTRNVEQVSRVILPDAVKHVLCANGGVLLNHGERDQSHRAWVESVLSQSTPVDEAFEYLNAFADLPHVARVRRVEDLFAYIGFHKRDNDSEAAWLEAAWLEDTRAWARDNNFTFSSQGRKVYLVPAGLSKGNALNRLRSLGGTVPLLAAGDSLLDAEMLNAADYSVRPGHGELSRAPELVPSAHVIPLTGYLAGEGILTHLLDTVRTLTSSNSTPKDS